MASFENDSEFFTHRLDPEQSVAEGMLVAHNAIHEAFRVMRPRPRRSSAELSE